MPECTASDCCCDMLASLAEAYKACCSHGACCAGEPAKKTCCDDCGTMILAAIDKAVANLKTCC